MKNFSVKVFSEKLKSTITITSEMVKMLGQQKVYIFILVPILYFLLRMRHAFIIGSRSISRCRVYKFMRKYSLRASSLFGSHARFILGASGERPREINLA